MNNIFIVGKVRGFFKHLINIRDEQIAFEGNSETYEVSSGIKTLLSKILKTRLVGWFGIYSVIKINDKLQGANFALSFNRFLKSETPYLIYLENPTALCNYSLFCIKSPFVKKKLIKNINDEKLKKIICMSDACKNTLSEVLGIEIPAEKLTRIYPYVPKNAYVNKQVIIQRCKQNEMKMLYIAQGARFYSKGGLEVIEAYRKLKNKYSINLTIITNVNCLDQLIKEKIEGLGIALLDFSFSYHELEKIYAQHHLLLQPSSDDSFGLTVIESMKAGLPGIVSDMYGFKEMIKDGENGFYVEPSYRFFDERDIPNPLVWNHRRETIYSKKLNEKLARELKEKIEYLYNNRSLLQKMSLCSYEKANTEFSEEYLLGQWKELNVKG